MALPAERVSGGASGDHLVLDDTQPHHTPGEPTVRVEKRLDTQRDPQMVAGGRDHTAL